MNGKAELSNVHCSSLLRQDGELSSNREYYSFEQDKDFLVYIYRSLADVLNASSLNHSLTELIKTGTARFNLSEGVLLKRLSPVVFDVVAFNGNPDEFYVGRHLLVEELPCVKNLLENSADSTKFSTLVIERSEYSFVGVKLTSSCGQEYVLYFEQKTGRRQRETSDDYLDIQLLAEGVAFMIEQNNALAQKKLEDQGINASGTVRSLEDYLEQAKIPETFGVPARVVEVLERRIGEKSLSIASVAEDLNLSKRTLQRRLQQQDVNFADLRDKVRYHYSIDYLIKQFHSIDAISALLDFSDRTSFTNAFKRWTGLSPSSFRKLFRDYV